MCDAVPSINNTAAHPNDQRIQTVGRVVPLCVCVCACVCMCVFLCVCTCAIAVYMYVTFTVSVATENEHCSSPVWIGVCVCVCVCLCVCDTVPRVKDTAAHPDNLIRQMAGRGVPWQAQLKRQ